jgi:hypothetical protein
LIDKKEKTMLRLNLKRRFILFSGVTFLLAVEARTSLAAAEVAEEAQGSAFEEIEPQIVNGQDISAEVWPQVVFLSTTRTLATASPPTRTSGCTGTLLARSTVEVARVWGFARRGDIVLTAAHCVAPDQAGRVTTQVAYIRGESNTTGQTTRIWRRNSSYLVGTVGRHDIALVFFANRNGFTNGLPICEQQPNVGTQVTLVGFGCNDYPGDINSCTGGGPDNKRRGINTLRVVGDTIEFTGPVRDGDGTTQTTASGDSGSPYIVAQNGIACIAAVNSGTTSFTPGSTKNSVGANLQNASSRNFFITQIPAFQLSILQPALTMFLSQ